MARLGIHTRVHDREEPEESHAWVTFVDGDLHEDYALCPDHADYKDHDREGYSDIVYNIHDDAHPTTSLYADLSPQQEDDFQYWLYQQVEVVEARYATSHNNAAHWARDAWQWTTGQMLDVDSSMPWGDSGQTTSVASPVGLEKSIRACELREGQERETSPDALDLKTFDPPVPDPAPEPPAEQENKWLALKRDREHGFDHDH